MDYENKPLLPKHKADSGFSRIVDPQSKDYANVLNPHTANYTNSARTEQPPPYNEALTHEVVFKDNTFKRFAGEEGFIPEEPQNSKGKHVITCNVCQEKIDISGKTEQFVVKCNTCLEATPIQNPPTGKKYVRCSCKCLLVCKVSSQRIACPRPNCKRVINLASPATPPAGTVPVPDDMCRVICSHCAESFVFNRLTNALARCPHCRKVSSVGPEFARGRGILFLVMGLTAVITSVIFVLLTYSYAGNHKIYIFLYMFALMCAIVLLCRSLYYYTMKVSDIYE